MQEIKEMTDYSEEEMNYYEEGLIDKIQELEREVEVQKQRVILSESQNYCKICGNILDGYVPPKEKK